MILDYVHVMFKGIPDCNISKLIYAYKSASSRLIKKYFLIIISKLWKSSFWSKSFCLFTTGGVTIYVIKQYIETRWGKEMNIALKIRIYPNKIQSEKINKI